MSGGHGASGILRVGFEPQTKCTLIDLGFTHHGVLKLRRLAEEENEEASGHWVESTAVADFRRVKRMLDAVHDIEAGPLLPLVRQEDAIDVISYLLGHFWQSCPCPVH